MKNILNYRAKINPEKKVMPTTFFGCSGAIKGTRGTALVMRVPYFFSQYTKKTNNGYNY